MRKSTISMVIFNSYVSLPEGKSCFKSEKHLRFWKILRRSMVKSSTFPEKSHGKNPKKSAGPPWIHTKGNISVSWSPPSTPGDIAAHRRAMMTGGLSRALAFGSIGYILESICVYINIYVCDIHIIIYTVYIYIYCIYVYMHIFTVYTMIKTWYVGYGHHFHGANIC